MDPRLGLLPRLGCRVPCGEIGLSNVVRRREVPCRRNANNSIHQHPGNITGPPTAAPYLHIQSRSQQHSAVSSHILTTASVTTSSTHNNRRTRTFQKSIGSIQRAYHTRQRFTPESHSTNWISDIDRAPVGLCARDPAWASSGAESKRGPRSISGTRIAVGTPIGMCWLGSWTDQVQCSFCCRPHNHKFKGEVITTGQPQRLPCGEILGEAGPG